MSDTATATASNNGGGDDTRCVLPDFRDAVINAKRDAITAEFYAEVLEAFSRAIKRLERLKCQY
jgi:hypothetical protein